jgi:hypothetical protein
MLDRDMLPVAVREEPPGLKARRYKLTLFTDWACHV